ncbi:MAG: [FeFe] hydrogenase H-cluster maturation GTPase HydF [Thomasclavelia sp.]|uniref:[FeFe] hydrogenase H-cluster maturation GTPase HydF n=1 Tax=Thomasclavelia sp. TaxID=3025757 RepID=UPI0039A25EB5
MAGFNQTPGANRLHIGFFGKRNSGKSSLINAFVSQEVSIVSSEAGTTTDPVYKAIEIHGLGPCLLIDTAGFDDIGTLGKQRIDKTKKVSEKIDIAIILFTDENIEQELNWYNHFKEKHIPVILVISKIDLSITNNLIKTIFEHFKKEPILTSSITNQGILELKEALINNLPKDFEKESITGTLVKSGDLVLLVMPQDIQAPKGRLILPQVQVLRELLDKKCQVISVTTDQMINVLNKLKMEPDLVITDSQVFKYVDEHISKQTKLTSFSVLMAGYKGDLNYYIDSIRKLEKLSNDSNILIAECCSHAPLSEDIGRVKIPRMLKKRYPDINIDIVSGTDFPNDLAKYDLVITCGGCMFNRRYIMSRVDQSKEQHIAMTNYGIFIAYVNNILDRVVY